MIILNLVMWSLTILGYRVGLGRKQLESKEVAHLKKHLRLIIRLAHKFPYCHQGKVASSRVPAETRPPFLNFLVVFKVI